MSEQTPKIHFVYWGRRGALSLVALRIAEQLADEPGDTGSLSFSTSNELAADLSRFEPSSWPFRTFGHGSGAFTRLPRMLTELRRLTTRLQQERYAAVVVLMPHVWTPFLRPRVQRLGMRYAIVVHDASRHPGDRTAMVQGWMHRDLEKADAVIALSENVAANLANERHIARERITVIPHPPLVYEGSAAPRNGGPLRILFLGRILAYKGLPLLVDAAEELKRRGVAIRLGVFGEGDLGDLRGRLDALGAEVVNRWIGHREIGPILSRYHVLALPYVEASQSGVAAAALGAAMPVVATPVGGLTEQIRDGITGLIAKAVSGEAIADSIARIATAPGLFNRLSAGAEAAGEASVADFMAAVRKAALAS